MLKKLSFAAFAAAAMLAPVLSHASDGTINITGRVGSATCKVAPASVAIPVTLDDVMPADLKAEGDTAKPKDFKIGLDCTGNASNVYMTLSDATTPANRTDILSTTTTSAKGVGIQILHGATLVKYGADSAAVGNLNQFLVGTAAEIIAANNEITFTARYVRTAPAVTIGAVNAVATFTMSYQ